jgi:hypothetical protein
MKYMKTQQVKMAFKYVGYPGMNSYGLSVEILEFNFGGRGNAIALQEGHLSCIPDEHLRNIIVDGDYEIDNNIWAFYNKN